MPLVADNSIPYPFDAPDVWDVLRLRGVSGAEYVWPAEPRLLGQVLITCEPPDIRTKESVKSGASKPRVKDVGSGNAKLSLAFQVTRYGWPTFIALRRLLVESKDGPWRVLHPEPDMFVAAAFKLAKHLKIDSTVGGIINASCELGEVDPQTQGGNGKGVGVSSPGASKYNLEADAYNAFIAQQKQFEEDRRAYIIAGQRADALVKPGVLVAKHFPVKKAIAYGKIEL